MLTMTLRSTDRDLTTTGALRARVLGATSTSTAEDVLLSGIIRAASIWAESYVGQPLSVQSYEERVATFGTRRLMLDRTPIRSLRVFESTEADSAEVTSTQFWLDAEAGIVERDEGWPWTVAMELELEERPVPGEETAPWYVTYQAGYTYNGLTTASGNYSTAGGTTDTGRTLPEDIEEAVLFKAQDLYNQAVSGGEVDSERLGDLSINYKSGGFDQPGGVLSVTLPEMLLANYRRVV